MSYLTCFRLFCSFILHLERKPFDYCCNILHVTIFFIYNYAFALPLDWKLVFHWHWTVLYRFVTVSAVCTFIRNMHVINNANFVFSLTCHFGVWLAALCRTFGKCCNLSYKHTWFLYWTAVAHIHCESKKGRHYTLVHIFAKYWPIFIILSPTYSVGNWQ